MLLAGGVGTGLHSFEMLRHHMSSTAMESAHAHGHALTESLNLESILAGDISFSLAALIVLVLSIGVKEALFWATLRVARRAHSDVLVANAWHHRADSISSFVALIGVGGAVAGLPILDPIGGILVSGMIVQASLTMLMPTLRELSDSAPTALVQRAEAILDRMMKSDENIVGYQTVRGRKMGPDHLLDLQLQVNPRISVSQSHQISENVRHAILMEIPKVTEVLIHVDVEEHDHSEKPVSTPIATSDIEEAIKVQSMQGFENEILRISHLKVHFLAKGLEVVAEIVPAREGISFKDAVEIARRFRSKLMTLEGVVAADVHLEAMEHEGEEDVTVETSAVLLQDDHNHKHHNHDHHHHDHKQHNHDHRH
ncbi:hypothetical protein HDU97_006066 [Phlyctochytrium planicorne]|nr:hypothetical protein HDU97_006066 [Phlyctochytrium planicorne]